ncbi:hypothetical protein BAE44_0021008 [Dichanthelium oligosanthes]|uniref:KIB1-4 beta-propeller domain-containing protein n=1 Tax=Dichanthelium oligosanthes TaxID=888268 RepID=A0A1E5UYQ3_9POAL|nr:hypothetical protein BAE44_0021008 [Dichanthelium oligosanthes]
MDDDGEWDDWDYAAPLRPDSKLLESSPNTNPVVHGGLLYVFYDDGKLAVYDESRHSFTTGELMAVLFGRRGTPVRIVKLNEQEMEWEVVENLGGRALFTGTLTTLMRKTKVKWMQNKVFFPRLYDWPETVHVNNIVDRDGELAFIPTSAAGAGITAAAKDGKSMWSHELGSEESAEFWDTERLDFGLISINNNIDSTV